MLRHVALLVVLVILQWSSTEAVSPLRPRPVVTSYRFICPRGYIRAHALCYQVRHGSLSWLQARGTCGRVSRSQTLAYIPTPFHMATLLRRLNKHRTYWIGLNDLRTEKKFIWARGREPQSSRYRNWASGEPNNHKGREDCVSIRARKNGRWNDWRCSNKTNWICSRPARRIRRPAPRPRPPPKH